MSDLADARENAESTAVSVEGRLGRRVGMRQKLSYALRIAPGYTWQKLTRRLPRGTVHLIIALADHFEPAIVPGDGRARAPYAEQEQRLERWCREYPKAIDAWRDHDGRPFIHTYFYPAEQYNRGLMARLAEHCLAGWGELEVHLHHGIPLPDSAANLRRTLTDFRDRLALEHGCLSCADGDTTPRYAFVHGNFALANSAGGFGCGVDDELQVLADTGCFADMTLPTNPFNPAQRAKINSLYECALPLTERAAYRAGLDLQAGRAPKKFPLMIQGPLAVSFSKSGAIRPRIENGSFTGANVPTLDRLRVWKHAQVSVRGRPDWLFLKLHCHGMDPTQEDAVLGASFRRFLQGVVEGASERGEILHFVSAREMVNVILAACDGKDGNPGDYRNYHLKPWKQLDRSGASVAASTQKVARN